MSEYKFHSVILTKNTWALFLGHQPNLKSQQGHQLFHEAITLVYLGFHSFLQLFENIFFSCRCKTSQVRSSLRRFNHPSSKRSCACVSTPGFIIYATIFRIIGGWWCWRAIWVLLFNFGFYLDICLNGANQRVSPYLLLFRLWKTFVVNPIVIFHVTWSISRFWEHFFQVLRKKLRKSGSEMKSRVCFSHFYRQINLHFKYKKNA